jgi:hypothetical protein
MTDDTMESTTRKPGMGFHYNIEYDEGVFRKDSVIFQLLDCRTDENTPGKCTKPVPTNIVNHNNNPVPTYKVKYDVNGNKITVVPGLPL